MQNCHASLITKFTFTLELGTANQLNASDIVASGTMDNPTNYTLAEGKVTRITNIDVIKFVNDANQQPAIMLAETTTPSAWDYTYVIVEPEN